MRSRAACSSTSSRSTSLRHLPPVSRTAGWPSSWTGTPTGPSTTISPPPSWPPGRTPAMPCAKRSPAAITSPTGWFSWPTATDTDLHQGAIASAPTGHYIAFWREPVNACESFTRLDRPRRGAPWRHARARRVHVCLREGLVVRHRQLGRVCELPHHDRAVRRLDEEQPPLGGRVQRLPRAARLPGQVRHESPQRVLALVLLHDRKLPGADPRDAQEPLDRRDQLPPLSRARGGSDGHACTRRIARDLVCALSWIRWPHGARSDQRCGRREVNRD